MGRLVDTAYPHELAQTVVLADGTRVQSRPIRPDDATRLIDLYARLTPATAYQRFFTARQRLPAEWAHRLANVDYDRRLALVAEPEIGGTGELIAVARYESTDEPDAAEVAVVVQDSWQGRVLVPRS